MISVIIPCYNYGHLVGDTIQSIIDQTFKDWELIVVNDGSRDTTEQVVRSMMAADKRIQYVFQENAGLGASRNKGLELASGDFIQFLDADDLLEKSKFEIQLQLFTENPIADIVYGSVRYFKERPYDPSDRLLTYWGKDEEWMPRITGKGSTLLKAALSITPAHLSSVLFRKKLVDAIGFFDNSISAVADYDFLLRCCLADAFFFYHDTPGTYSLVRWHPDNMSKNLSLMFGQEIRLREKLHDSLPTEELKEQNRMAIESHKLRMRKSWKKVFLSGGPLDFVKKGLKTLGLDRMMRKIFYK